MTTDHRDRPELTAVEVARLTGLHRDSIIKAARAGRLRGVQRATPGQPAMWFFVPRDVEEWRRERLRR